MGIWLINTLSICSLTLTLLLTMATQVQGFNQGLPQVSYMKAIDVWTGTCMSFLMLAILETSTVTYLVQLRNDQEEQNQNQVSDWNEDGKKISLTKRKKTFMLDKVCRILFPLIFIAFTIGYYYIFVAGENYQLHKRH